MCEAPRLPTVISFFTKNFTLKSIRHHKICRIIFIAPLLFGFKLSEKREIQRGQVFVNRDIIVCLVITEAQLFFGSEKENFESVVKKLDQNRV